jgi:hypothetical protein
MAGKARTTDGWRKELRRGEKLREPEEHDIDSSNLSIMD